MTELVVLLVLILLIIFILYQPSEHYTNLTDFSKYKLKQLSLHLRSFLLTSVISKNYTKPDAIVFPEIIPIPGSIIKLSAGTKIGPITTGSKLRFEIKQPGRRDYHEVKILDVEVKSSLPDKYIKYTAKDRLTGGKYFITMYVDTRQITFVRGFHPWVGSQISYNYAPF